MIHIEKDQKILENEDLRVATPTGDYDDNALIEFYNVANPEVVAGAFAAQYIKYGSIVYKFNDAKELGAEILNIDPESTHNSASFVRMNNELLDKMNKGNLEVDSLDQVISDQKDIVEEKRGEEAQVTNEEVDEEVSGDAQSEDTGEVLGEDTIEEPIVEEEVVDEPIEVETPPVITDEDIIVPDTSGDSGAVIPPVSEIPSEEPATVAEEIIGFFTNKKSKNSKVARLVSKTRKVAKARRKII